MSKLRRYALYGLDICLLSSQAAGSKDVHLSYLVSTTTTLSISY